MNKSLLLTGCCLLLSVATAWGAEKEKTAADWRTRLARELPVLGHRNWIVVADSAYPAQSRPGIITVYAGGDHLAAVKEVLRALDASKHVRPVIHLDRELVAVPEADAPGITAFREKLQGLLQNRTVKTMPHEDVIRELDKSAQMFRILLIKTDMTLPYTSVFMQLDCGYWGPEKEARLRKAMGPAGK